MATGRSDYPNQVNNVLGFPFIFRGALDVRATADQRGDEDRGHPRAGRAGQGRRAGRGAAGPTAWTELEFGRDYIIPKPFDPRVLMWDAPAVAKAAMETGVAHKSTSTSTSTVRRWSAGWASRTRSCACMINKAQRQPKRVVFPEGDEDKILRACQILVDESIAFPILLGDEETIRRRAAELRPAP